MDSHLFFFTVTFHFQTVPYHKFSNTSTKFVAKKSVKSYEPEPVNAFFRLISASDIQSSSFTIILLGCARDSIRQVS